MNENTLTTIENKLEMLDDWVKLTTIENKLELLDDWVKAWQKRYNALKQCIGETYQQDNYNARSVFEYIDKILYIDHALSEILDDVQEDYNESFPMLDSFISGND